MKQNNKSNKQSEIDSYAKIDTVRISTSKKNIASKQKVHDKDYTRCTQEDIDNHINTTLQISKLNGYFENIDNSYKYYVDSKETILEDLEVKDKEKVKLINMTVSFDINIPFEQFSNLAVLLVYTFCHHFKVNYKDVDKYSKLRTGKTTGFGAKTKYYSINVYDKRVKCPSHPYPTRIDFKFSYMHNKTEEQVLDKLQEYINNIPNLLAGALDSYVLDFYIQYLQNTKEADNKVFSHFIKANADTIPCSEVIRDLYFKVFETTDNLSFQKWYKNFKRYNCCRFKKLSDFNKLVATMKHTLKTFRKK